MNDEFFHYHCIAQYPNGGVQDKICYLKSYRLHGLKLHGQRPHKIFLPMLLKGNVRLQIFLNQAMHPNYPRIIKFI